MIDRRRLLAATAGLAALPSWALAQADEAARLDALLTRQFEENMDRAPEGATSLGIDVGARAGQRSLLDDRSVAAFQANGQAAARRLAELKTIKADLLPPDARLSYDVALFQRQIADGYRRFPWHTPDGWRQTPYGVSQLGGAYAIIPDFLDTRHPIAVSTDVDAFIARLDAFATALDQDTERTRANAAMGVIAPDFILDKTRQQLIALRDRPGADQPMVRSLARRSAEKGLKDESAKAAAIFDGPVRAALDRQIAEIERLRVRSSHQAGVRRLPDGEAYYALNLRNFTTTEYTAQEIRRIGLDQVADLTSRIDALLRKEGYTKGTVAERLAGVRSEARFRFSNDDAGREQLLAYVNAEMAAIRARMPEIFPRIPRTDFVVRRVPVSIESGAPGGYAQGGSLDGSRPGTYYINLRDTAEWPRWTLKTLTYHEAAPGHLFQGALALEAGELPLYRRVGGFSAYGEGWGLYSERLADELGVYENDPFGRIGYLESFLFRACRLVVDTGLHHEDWSREQAIGYFAENLGDSNEAEVERYCVAPGQACSYKIGETFMSRLRDEFQARPGFDLKRFHAAMIDGGNIPLTVLERRVRAAFAS
ncbi:DUF885 domain-containing protein [Caulobacter sp. NIBR2454]|uniref:DUF885 domain-containing protein n=1 Tax=Caulobacter sp. NIBR2454 TaxID=3015996 RepID=UPI0022B6B834|nr:DUF885 family protein [Caulobacter sp. NIBR2454]